MKYWKVYYSKEVNKYQLTNIDTIIDFAANTIAVFQSFDMAYQYVTRMNCTNDVQAYSKWTVSR